MTIEEVKPGMLVQTNEYAHRNRISGRRGLVDGIARRGVVRVVWDGNTATSYIAASFLDPAEPRP